MLIGLELEIWEIVEGGTKRRGVGKVGSEWRENMSGLLSFVDLVCVCVYFCCSVGCLCQGLQGIGIV
jgi:hypothetical protein